MSTVRATTATSNIQESIESASHGSSQFMMPSSQGKFVLNTPMRSNDIQNVSESTNVKLGFAKFIQDNNSSLQHRSELEMYLDDPSHPDDAAFDILGWWRLHGPKYPIISQMARDILSVPISTVASEAAFSTAGRVLDEYRSNLLPETVEALMCTQDWLRCNIPDESRVTIDNELQQNMAFTPNVNQQDGSV